MDNFRDTNKEYYEDLKRGKVDQHDFERYIFGAHQNKNRDDRDKLDERVRKA